eukprot:3615638-Prorocentrum_lima.AAC.1
MPRRHRAWRPIPPRLPILSARWRRSGRTTCRWSAALGGSRCRVPGSNADACSVWHIGAFSHR